MFFFIIIWIPNLILYDSFNLHTIDSLFTVNKDNVSVSTWHVTCWAIWWWPGAYAVMQVSSPGRQCNHVSGLSIVSTLSTVHLHTLSTVCLHFPQTTALQSGGVFNSFIDDMSPACIAVQCVVRLVFSDSEIPVTRINIHQLLFASQNHSILQCNWGLIAITKWKKFNLARKWREESWKSLTLNVNWIFSQCGCGSWCSVLHHSINNCQTLAATFGG